MRKTIRGLLIGILIGAFVFFAANYLLIRRGYSESRKVYSEASEAYTRPAAAPERTAKDSAGESRREEEREEETPPPDCAPIEVDFDELTAVGRDVFGWIYCVTTFEQVTETFGCVGVEQTFLLEYGECVSVEHLGPLVAVIAGSITSTEDVGERSGHHRAIDTRQNLRGGHGICLKLLNVLELREACCNLV